LFWEDINGDVFPEIVREVQGVCLVPTGCLERHAHHLPLGTDMLVAREICQRASKLEPAVIFKDFYFTQILEARHYPGAFGLEPELILHLLENTCREIARNGFTKIVLFNTHGGNTHFLHFFAQGQLASPRDYAVYVLGPEVLPEDTQTINQQWETEVDGHAGENETSLILAFRPELVDLDRLPIGDEGMPLGRNDDLKDKGIYTGIWWYADQPTHYRGDGAYGTIEKGKRLLQANTLALAAAIRAIKKDLITQFLQQEFWSGLNS